MGVDSNMIQTFINRYFYYLFVFSLIFVILLYHVIGFLYIDEICAAALFGLFFYGMIKTPDWAFNKVFLFTLFVFLFYTGYSLWIGSNTKGAIFTDLIIQMKPYLGFFCVYQLRPVFTKQQKTLLKNILLAFWFLFLLPIGLISIFNEQIFWIVIEHPGYFGIAVSIVALSYLFCVEFTWRNKIIFLILLSLGIFCGRSKFYGFFAMSFFVVIFFSNINKFKFNFKNILLIGCMIVAVLFVAWEKIALYFYDALVGTSSVEKDMIARFVLYQRSPEILRDYFPFGSGLGSYGTFASGKYYSKIYIEYGIDGVWGLTKSYYSFVADTFYPSLVQFGIVGIVLFLSFWVYILRKAYICYKGQPNLYLQFFVLVILSVGFLFIEGTTAPTFTAQGGLVIMMLLGMLLSNMNAELKNNDLPA